MKINWRLLDKVRRRANPIQVDLIDAYAQNRISRRSFLRRGVIVGLSAPFMGSVLAACGDGESEGSGGNDTGSGDNGTDTTAGGSGGGEPVAGGDLRVGIQFGDANSGLDPLNMLDLGTYNVLSQSFEYLVGLGTDGNIGPRGLAESWTPNDDGSAWTFTLREGVTWQDGSPLTSADVAATIDRMVEVGAGLAGVVSEGAVETPDDRTAVINLDSPNGNLPVLVSIFNPQSLVTPADYSNGTTLDERPEGTGPWLFESHDATSFTTVFKANENYWGGRPNLDTVTLIGFEDSGTRISAMQARELDAIQEFGAVDGSSLLNDENMVILSPPAANHRQLWFNTQVPSGGPFTDPRVRQAVAYCLDRQQMVDTLFEGRAIVANDHPVHPSLPFFDEGATPQRERDIEKAKQLLAEAGQEGLTATLETGDIIYSADMAAIVEQNCAEAGMNITVSVTANSDFYGEYWCTGASWGAQPETGGPGVPCGASAPIGIVDYGHRPTPDIYFGRALQTDGDWNSSNYASAEFDQLFTEYQGAVDVDGQKAAVGKIQQLLHDDCPAAYPFFFDYLGGHDASVSGIENTALGHMLFQNASKTA